MCGDGLTQEASKSENAAHSLARRHAKRVRDLKAHAVAFVVGAIVWPDCGR
jgi:hypothetical protein